uniref:Non-specific lipid-transfer protein (Fragments) n=1 Tax=Broussonetia papyrifera TaxID=172644 RepID=NSLTP_BROPA
DSCSNIIQPLTPCLNYVRALGQFSDIDIQTIPEQCGISATLPPID